MTEIEWTEAIDMLKAEGHGDELYHALGSLLDGELELEQEDDRERVISEAELDRVRDKLRS